MFNFLTFFLIRSSYLEILVSWEVTVCYGVYIYRFPERIAEPYTSGLRSATRETGDVFAFLKCYVSCVIARLPKICGNLYVPICRSKPSVNTTQTT